MLYGDQNIRDEIMNDAMEIAREHEFQLVFAAVQGSISRGINRKESDYDIRFLYKKESMPFIDRERKYRECESVVRYYPQGNKIYDKIAFWDVETFVSFLINPQLDDRGLSVGLYNQFFWTFSSPFTWDPFGLAGKLLPLANGVINKQWMFEYCCQYISERNVGDRMPLRDYIYIIAAIWQMDWLMDIGTFPPLWLDSLKVINDDSFIRQIYEEFVQRLRQSDRDGGTRKRKGKLLVDRNEYLDKWVQNKILLNKNRILKEGKTIQFGNEKVIESINAILHNAFQMDTQ